MAGKEEHIKLLKSLPVFNKLRDQDIEIMLGDRNLLRVISYEPGETIIREHDFDRKIFLMIVGKLEITKEIFAGNSRKLQNLKTVEDRGTFIGEISALTGKPRTASVITAAKTICAVIDIEVLMKTSSVILERVKAKLYPKLFNLLCRRLEETSDQFVNIKQRIEEYDTELANLKREKMAMKAKIIEDLRKKNLEIRTLQKRVHDLESQLPKLK